MSQISKLQKKINKEIKEYPENIDSDGRSIVDITVHDDSTILSPYSNSNDELISNETANFIEHAIKPIKPKNPLHIRIHSDKITDNEKERYAKAIKNYYFYEMVDLQREIKRNIITAIILALVTIAILTLLYLVDQIFINQIIDELITIIGWVFLWEAVHIICFKVVAMNSERYRCINIIEAKISFFKLDELNHLDN